MNKILCVDDDPVTLMICHTMVKKNSFARDVVNAMDGQSAIEYYESLANSREEEKSNYPELILLDLNMPVMNGWDFLDEFIKYYYEIFPNTKVVILTSSIDPKDEERANNYSIAIGFLPKPLTNKMLIELTQLLTTLPQR